MRRSNTYMIRVFRRIRENEAEIITVKLQNTKNKEKIVIR